MPTQLASERERERLKALVSTLGASRRDQRAWEEIAAIAQALYTEAEITASSLSADLAAAMHGSCSQRTGAAVKQLDDRDRRFREKVMIRDRYDHTRTS